MKRQRHILNTFEMFREPETDGGLSVILARYKAKTGIEANQVAFVDSVPERFPARPSVKFVVAGFTLTAGNIAVYYEEKE